MSKAKILLFLAIARNGLISSSTQAARPKVPMTKSSSRSCITRSLTETVGKPFVHFSQLVPALSDKYRPSSVPKNIKFSSFGSSIIQSA